MGRMLKWVVRHILIDRLTRRTGYLSAMAVIGCGGHLLEIGSFVRGQDAWEGENQDNSERTEIGL